MQPAGTAAEGLSSFETFRRFVEELATTEGRLVVSAVVLLVTLVIAALVAPFLIRRFAEAVTRRLPSGRTRTTVEFVSGYVPTTFSGLLVRTVQIAILVLAVVALLVVWGLVDLAITILRLLGVSLPLVARVATTLALLLVAYIAADLLEDAVEQFSDETNRITDHQKEIILRIGHVGVLAFLLTGTLTLWGVNLSGLLVGAGFLGIVLGLAARQTLGSILAGFVLMFSRPFTIGDWIQVGENEGIVTNITIVNTHMRNFDGEYIVIPNDTVGNKPITNRSREGHLRIRLEVGIDYDTDPDHAADVALDAIEETKTVSETPAPQVLSRSFGDSSVVLELRFWIDRPTPPRRWRAIDEVVRAVKDAFGREGIKIPFPQRELSGRAETDGFRVRGPAAEVGTRGDHDARDGEGATPSRED